MIRRVAFKKAVMAGAAGAFAWEAVVRILLIMGVPLLDNVKMLGTMLAGHAGPVAWWPVGMALHAMVGAIWAIFYAYFFWSTFDWAPVTQGLVFSLGPAVLAGLIMIPQMGYMHPLVQSGELPWPGLFGWSFGWGGPAGDFIGHFVYGITLGSIYQRPVGYPASRTTLPYA